MLSRQLLNQGAKHHLKDKLQRTTLPSSVLSMMALAAFLKNQEAKSKQNECGGILAFVTNKKEEAKQSEEADQIADKKEGGATISKCLQFQLQHAHFLQRLPYYQCGLAINTSDNLKWFKYTSSGQVESSTQQTSEAAFTESPSGNADQIGDEEEEDQSDSDEKRNEQLGQVDYGFKEKAYVLPQDDCFTKLFDDIEKSSGKLNTLQGNISILHTRFAEVNKFYSIDKGLGGIPNEHAHPSIDKKERLALFHNGNLTNFEELWQEVQDKKTDCEVNQGFDKPSDSQLISALIGQEMDQGLSLKDAIINVIEQKILGTFRMAVLETKNPKCIYFVKNSGDFVIGTTSDKSEVIVTTDTNVLSASGMVDKHHHTNIPNNELCELNQETCEFTFTKLEKKIKIESQRKPKASYNHIFHEEIYESIDAIDQATDFGGKFISDNQVVLGGFEKAHQELSQVQDLIIQALGSSFYASKYGAYIFKQLRIFNTVRIVEPKEVNPLLFKNYKAGGFLTVSRTGSDQSLVNGIKLAYSSDLTCMNIVNSENSPITKAIDEVLRERKTQASADGKQQVLFNADSDDDDEDLDEEFQDKNIGMYQKSGNCYTDVKTFIPQVVCLSLVGLWFSSVKMQTVTTGYTLDEKKAIIEDRKKILQDIGYMSLRLKYSLQANYLAQYKEVAKFLKTQDNLFLLSKGTGTFVSDFAAQKFVQIAGIHAEAYASGEFRHGPLSMIDESEKTAIIFLVLDDEGITQILSNILQVKERGATVIVITNLPKIETKIDVDNKVDYLIRMQEHKSIFAALNCTIPLMMMCYYTALEKGINPDEQISDAINFMHEVKKQ